MRRALLASIAAGLLVVGIAFAGATAATAAPHSATSASFHYRVSDPGCVHYCDWITNTDGVRVPCGETNEGRIEFVNQWTGEFDRCDFQSPWRGRPFGYEWVVAGWIGG